MDYVKVYQQLISKAQLRGKIMPAERHHIIPRSMAGKDRKNNIVYFTPHEHLVAHLLLWKIHRNRSMAHALWMMIHTRDGVRINGRQYEILRLEHSKNTSERNKGKKLSEDHKEKVRQANLGKKHSEEACRKMSESQKGRKATDETKARMSESQKGRKHSDETKAKISSANKGRVVSVETREKISNINKGKPAWNKGLPQSDEHRKNNSLSKIGKPGARAGRNHSEETKEKMRISARNKPPVTEETKIKLRCKKKARPIIQCPHCDKTGDASGMKRWHFDNCKTLLTRDTL